MVTHRDGSKAHASRMGGTTLFKPPAGLVLGRLLDECKCLISLCFYDGKCFYKEDSTYGIKNDSEVGKDWRMVRALLYWVPNRTQENGNRPPAEAELVEPEY